MVIEAQRMARPRISDDIKRNKGTYRRPLTDECPHALKRKQKARGFAIRGEITGELLTAYEEAVDEIESVTPHFDDSHGMPEAGDLEYIGTVESVINPHVPESLHLKAGKLFRMILGSATIR